MEFFSREKVVRLRSSSKLYLAVVEDERAVVRLCPDEEIIPQNQKWTVHCVQDRLGRKRIQLASCYNTHYLSTERIPTFLGLGWKVRVQPMRRHFDESFWIPIRVDDGDGKKFKFRSRWGYLWANCGARVGCSDACSVTDDQSLAVLKLSTPCAVWNVEIVKEVSKKGSPYGHVTAPPSSPLLKQPPLHPEWLTSIRDLLDKQCAESDGENSPKPVSFDVLLGPTEVGDSQERLSLPGRTIYYSLAAGDCDIGNGLECPFTFQGTTKQELTAKIKDETKLVNIEILMENPATEMLEPLRLLILPPEDVPLRFVVFDQNSQDLNSRPPALRPPSTSDAAKTVDGLQNQGHDHPNDCMSTEGNENTEVNEGTEGSDQESESNAAQTVDDLQNQGYDDPKDCMGTEGGDQESMTYGERTGKYKIRFTVTDDIKKVTENGSDWFGFIHFKSLNELTTSLKEETLLNDIHVFGWDYEKEMVFPFDPSIHPEDNLIRLVVVDLKARRRNKTSVKSHPFVEVISPPEYVEVEARKKWRSTGSNEILDENYLQKEWNNLINIAYLNNRP